MANSSDDSNRHPWKQTAWQARQAVSESLVALPNNYPPQKSVGVSEYHELAQTYLFEYFSVFEPKKTEFGGDLDPREADKDELNKSLWWEPLLNVELPVDGTVRLNGKADILKNGASRRQVLSAVGDRLPRRTVTLRLATIRQLYQSQSTFQVSVNGWVDNQGPVERTVQETRYLPIAAIHEVRGQLDDCLEEAGWLPEIASTHRTEITEEMLEEVEEWRQQNINQ